MNKEEQKVKLKELVEQFASASKNKDYLNGQNEEYIKWNYLEPLLTNVLGWRTGDIEKEKRILKGRADYMLKLGNKEVMVVEAKKASVNLSEDEGKQAVSYAYHRKVKLAIVTNFKEIKVYHALTNIKQIDQNLIKFESGGYFRFSFEQFLENFDKLMFLSRENFENKTVYKLVPSKIEKVSKPIDESILYDLLQFRDWLSKDLKKTRMQLTKEQIDEVVQMLIDRLIFMRSVEDRGLESANFLLGLVDDVRLGRTDKTLWTALKEQFKTFDKSYNSKLFAEGLLEKEGFFDEQTLVKVIRGLYFGTKEQQARYMFDEIPGDLLGNIYEQYLGTILSGTEKRVKLDEESGKRKKMGIYYTPSYIVDYIIRNTVGEYVKNKNIDEILGVKIVDPACGSGSFIVRAFQEVCNAIEERLKKGEKGKMATFQSYKDRLSFAQKISILTQCIYGIDLDEKAVELAQLNLLLKLLEDESPESHKRLLPNLRENIKCGNSLIDKTEVAKDKSFNWEAQFKEVFRDGGFDLVIGNPPYVFGGNCGITENEKNYFKTNYSSAKGKLNLFSLFIEKSINLIKNNGKLAFIIPNTLLRVTSYEDTRRYILEKTNISQIVNLNPGVFEDVTAATIIIILEKQNNLDMIKKNKVKLYEGILGKLIIKPQSEFTSSLSIFDIGSEEGDNKFVDKIKVGSINLGDISKEMIFGVVITKNKDEVVSNKKINEKYKKFLEGRDVDRYLIKFSNKFLLYEKSKLHRARTPEIFEADEKILVQRISGGKRPLKAAYDNQQYYDKESINNIILSDKNFDSKYVLALLNSNLINWFYSMKFTNASLLTVNVSKAYLSLLPIKIISLKEQKPIISLVDKMMILQKNLYEDNLTGNERERLDQQINNTNYEIDQEVYKLYGITKEEQKIIEESLK